MDWSYSQRIQIIRKLAASKALKHIQFTHDLRGPAGEELVSDFFLLRPEKEKILLHISGTHGAEGYIGSMIQEEILSSLDSYPKDQGLCIVHALNPFGMAWMRRTNADNVDLNRNGIDFGNIPKSPDYIEVADFLEPQGWGARAMQLPGMLQLLSGWGKERFASAVASGQYERPKGVFYGGSARSWELRNLEKVLSEKCPNLRSLSVLDVHSGLGSFNHEFLIADITTKLEQVAVLGKIFDGRIHVPSPETGYVVRGAVGEFLGRIFPDAAVRHITQEFGTYNTLTNFACVIEENSRWHSDSRESHARPGILRRVFFPDNKKWRKDCTERGVRRFHQLSERLP